MNETIDEGHAAGSSKLIPIHCLPFFSEIFQAQGSRTPQKVHQQEELCVGGVIKQLPT